MEFKGKKEREVCYKARDAYFACLDSGDNSKCDSFLKDFEKTCGSKWKEHFIRKRDYEKFKDKLYTEGEESVDKRKI